MLITHADYTLPLELVITTTIDQLTIGGCGMGDICNSIHNKNILKNKRFFKNCYARHYAEYVICVQSSK